MPSKKPYVALACLCEKVLTEADGVLSLVRIVDQFTLVVPPNLPEGVKPHVVMTLALGLRSREHVGKHEIVLQMHGPTKVVPLQPVSVEFPLSSVAGGFSAVNVMMTMVIGVENFGPCRIDVSFEGEELTTVPFTLVQGQVQSVAEPGPNQ